MEVLAHFLHFYALLPSGVLVFAENFHLFIDEVYDAFFILPFSYLRYVFEDGVEFIKASVMDGTQACYVKFSLPL